jgi:hypothetical protein
MTPENYHFVQHLLRPGDYVQTKFTCTAPEGAACRVACKTCADEERERCECSWLRLSEEFGRVPNMQDFGYCLQTVWLSEDAPEEMYAGDRQPVRGPEPQPINVQWIDDCYGWEYA